MGAAARPGRGSHSRIYCQSSAYLGHVTHPRIWRGIVTVSSLPEDMVIVTIRDGPSDEAAKAGLFFGFSGEEQRVALAAGSVSAGGGLFLGHLACKD